MTRSLPALSSLGDVQATVNGCLGLITLNRPQALNALTLPMVRDMTALLMHWTGDASIQAVAVVGQSREGKPPAFCAGGDIRFFHEAARVGDPALEDFFTEEYALNHLIHCYPKPYIALMDGVVMGGGMGISQGARLRVVNERSRLAMPETRIGLFPDVGGGHFLGQCPGSTGEWLALTGQALGAGDALELGLADVFVPASHWPDLLRTLTTEHQPDAEHVVACVMQFSSLGPPAQSLEHRKQIDDCFSLPTLPAIWAAVKTQTGEWGQRTAAQLAQNSPMAMAMSLELIRRGRSLSLSDDLRLERNLVWHCFAPARDGSHCETLEGIRALTIDKDHAPNWSPADVNAIDASAVEAMFASPWPAAEHPLAALDKRQ